MNALRLSTPQEVPLQASKWLYLQFLLDSDEMKLLFDELGDFLLFSCASVSNLQEGSYSKEQFLECYQHYIAALKAATVLPVIDYQRLFSLSLTTSASALYAIQVSEHKQLIRIAKPIVQMQPLTIDYSPFDQKFRSNVYGTHHISWGIQCSFPQLLQHSISKEILPIRNREEFPNLALFQMMQKWMRHYTIPTPFVVDGIKTNVSIRIGRQCLAWINCHPALVAKNIKVVV